MPRFMIVAACAALFALSAVACGGDDEDEPTETATTVASATAETTTTATATTASSPEASATATPTATTAAASPTATEASGPKTVVVQLGPASYSPSTVTIAAGDTVEWHWNNGVPHSVTSRGGFASNPEGVKTEGTYSFTFTTAGTFDYHCQVHESDGMTGQVVVQ